MSTPSSPAGQVHGDLDASNFEKFEEAPEFAAGAGAAGAGALGEDGRERPWAQVCGDARLLRPLRPACFFGGACSQRLTPRPPCRAPSTKCARRAR